MAKKKTPKTDVPPSENRLTDDAKEAQKGSTSDPSLPDTADDKALTDTSPEVDDTSPEEETPDTQDKPAAQTDDVQETTEEKPDATADFTRDEAREAPETDELNESPGTATVEAVPDDTQDAVDATKPTEDAEPETQPTVEDQATRTEDTTTPPAKVEQVVVKKGGLVPMVFGGLLAGGAGFAAAYFGLLQQPDDGADLAQQVEALSSNISVQEQTIDGLATRLDALPASPDLAPIDGQIADIAAQAADLGAAISSAQAEISAVSSRLDEIDQRVTQLEQQPVMDGASDAAVAAYERTLQTARDEIAQQVEDARAQIEEELAAMNTQSSELEAMIAAAKFTEAEAAEAARHAAQRAALSRIASAVEAGAPFSPALADLEATGVTAPDALAAVAADGVPSAAALQDSFPDVARQALSDARNAAAQSGEVGGFSDFLRSQLGARSLEPQDGDGADAVLSRAEAAVREGRLQDAIAELDSLPEAGKAVVTDWVSRAERRLEALNAVETLSENLN